jgi:hypothetical protein
MFTVTGGTGAALFGPCFAAGSHGGNTSISIGGITGGSSGGPINFCAIPPFFETIPFTFGVPQIVSVKIAGSVGTIPFLPVLSDGSTALDQFVVFDLAGNQLSNVTLTLVEVPEPSAWSLIAIGLVLFLPPLVRHRLARRVG